MPKSTAWKLAALTAAIGAAAGAGIALLMSGTFVGVTTLQIGPDESGTIRWQRQAQQVVLSRVSLAAIIQKPDLDLYRAERARLPLEDVIETMRAAVKVEKADAGRVRVSFAYSDPAQAQSAVEVLGIRLADEISRVAKAEGREVRVVAAPELPKRERSRAADLGVGAAVGALLGPALLLLRRRSLHWYLMILGFAIAGAVAAELAAYFGDVVYPADAQLGVLGGCAGVLAGVLLLRRGGRPLGIAGVLFAAGSLGAIAAGAIAFGLPQQYVSSATLRMSTPVPPGNPAAPRIRELTERILSRSSMAEIIQRPSLDVYRAQRARLPMETVVGILRRDLHIEPVFEGGADATLAISFRYSDPQKAQAVLREIVSRYMEENAQISRRAGEVLTVPGSLNFVIIDPPSMPATPAAPNRLLLMVGGAVAGLGIAMLTWWVRRQTLPRRRNLLRIALSAGAAAAVIAAVIALASPTRYLSTATVRMVPAATAAEAGAADDLQTRLGEATGSQALIELIRQPGLDLYAKERVKLPIKDVLQLMRERDLRIETLQVSAAGRTESLRIAFEYPDREKAHGFVQALVSRLVEQPAASDRLSRAYVEVLDPPSVPDAPQLPDRPTIIAAGLIAGLLLGSAAILLRPRPAQTVLAG